MSRSRLSRTTCTMLCALVLGCFSDEGNGGGGDGGDGAPTTDDGAGDDGGNGSDSTFSCSGNDCTWWTDDTVTWTTGTTSEPGTETTEVPTTGGTTMPPMCNDGVASVGEFCPGMYQPIDTVNPPARLAVGAFDGDGTLDIITAETADGESHPFLGDGQGGFTRGSGDSFSSPWDVAVGHFDNDVNLDVVYSLRDDNRVGIHPGDGSGSISGANLVYYDVGSAPQAIAVGDLDNNGFDDIVVCNYLAGQLQVLTSAGDGSGNFMVRAPNLLTLGANSRPTDVALSRINLDNNLDVAVTLEFANEVEVRMGNGFGTLGAATTGQTGLAPEGVAAGDFDNDGLGDVAVADTGTNTISALWGRGDGTFWDPQDVMSGDNPSAVAMADMNNDGLHDIVVAHLAAERVTVFLSNDMRGFDPPIHLDLLGGAGHMARDVVVADFNADDALDIAVSSSGNGLGMPRFGVFISRP